MSIEESIKNIRSNAEKHWAYTELIIKKAILYTDPDMDQISLENLMDLAKTLYIEPFVHGYKHRLEEEGLI